MPKIKLKSGIRYKFSYSEVREKSSDCSRKADELEFYISYAAIDTKPGQVRTERYHNHRRQIARRKQELL